MRAIQLRGYFKVNGLHSAFQRRKGGVDRFTKAGNASHAPLPRWPRLRHSAEDLAVLDVGAFEAQNLLFVLELQGQLYEVGPRASPNSKRPMDQSSRRCGLSAHSVMVSKSRTCRQAALSPGTRQDLKLSPVLDAKG